MASLPPLPNPLVVFLRAEMQAQGMSNGRLATHCGVSPSVVSRWVNGRVVPLAKNCECIARALHAEPVEVLRLAGHAAPGAALLPANDEWAAKQREWARRFERRVHSLTRDGDDCTERCVTAWLDGFSLMVDRLGV